MIYITLNMLIVNMCLNLNTCLIVLLTVMTILPNFFVGNLLQGACYARKGLHSNYWLGEYCVAGYSHHPLNYADSNPGKINLPQVAWEGISLIIWRYWGKCLAFKCSRW